MLYTDNQFDLNRLEVLFIIPESRTYEYLGLSYLSSSLQKNGISSKILQLESIEELEYLIKNSKNLSLVGITWLYSYSENSVIKIAKYIKSIRFEIAIVVGGHPPSLNYANILKENPEINYILRGEADFGIFKLINLLKKKEIAENISGLSYINENGEVICNKLYRIDNLDLLTFPDRSQLDKIISLKKNQILISILGSRGCYASCNFCSMVSFYACNETNIKWIGRSPENILDEIKIIISKFQINTFWFIDDEFIGPPKKGRERVLSFAELIIKNNIVLEYGFDARANGIAAFSDDDLALLKRSGLKMISIGIESGSQNMLDRMNKRIDVKLNWQAIHKLIRNKIDYRYGFIMYDPETNFDDINQNLKFLLFAKPYRICNTGAFRLLNSLFPHTGTKFTKTIKGKTEIMRNSLLNNFPEYSEDELGYTFINPNISRYRNILYQFARSFIEPKMIQRTNETNNIWYGVNDLPQNIAIMDAFLECHIWLAENIQYSESNLYYLTEMQCIFTQYYKP
ncbi:MAG: B12-binding domain-containing radical SAM protein [Bacteroidetes bacterium]|nr:B12-binding domain-containing radical SAM protein [Bacteroidota bacterium]